MLELRKLDGSFQVDHLGKCHNLASAVFCSLLWHETLQRGQYRGRRWNGWVKRENTLRFETYQQALLPIVLAGRFLFVSAVMSEAHGSKRSSRLARRGPGGPACGLPRGLTQVSSPIAELEFPQLKVGRTPTS